MPHGEAACYLAAALLSTAQVRGPYRHYVLNLLWILTLLFCLLLAAHHLRQLHRQTSTCLTSELILPSLSREYTESRSSALSILSSDALQVSANPLAHLLCCLA